MIAKKYRFQGWGSLKFLLSRGQTLKIQGLKVRYVHNRRRTDFRLTIIVSKKIDKRAVIRNKIRRRLYEIFRLQLQGKSWPIDCAVIVHSVDLAWMPYIQLQAVCESVLAQIKTQYPA